MQDIVQNNPITFQTQTLKTLVKPQGIFKILCNDMFHASVVTKDKELDVVNSRNEVFKYNIHTDLHHIGGSFWLSSIAMLLYIESNKHRFEDKSILELGCGIGLPGIHIANACQPHKVTLSDLDVSVTHKCLLANGSYELGNIEVRQLDWNAIDNTSDKYDIIIASDCIYRTNGKAFVNALTKLIKEKGRFVIFNAVREGIDEILYMMQEHYEVTIKEIELCLDNTYVIKLLMIVCDHI